MAENELSVANIPLNEDEIQNYLNQFFEKVFSNDSYIKRNEICILLQKAIHL